MSYTGINCETWRKASTAIWNANRTTITPGLPTQDQDRKQESWRSDHIDIDDRRLSATVSMRSTFASDTDTKGFHLSFITALEFLSQLQIVYIHVWAGRREQTLKALGGGMS
ncbi:MAG: hypothetical protein HGA75_11495 [Thiobacillus sp.]|nr:hypothetical protein [Thiobacillus sp.]